MATAKLTEKLIADAEPGEKVYEICDSMKTGLRLRVTPAGKKVLVVVYKIGRKKTRTTIGLAEEIKLKAARDYAGEIINGADFHDLDFNSERRKKNEAERAEASNTLGNYLDSHWEPYAKKNIKSQHNMRLTFNKNFSNLYARPLMSLTGKDIEDWRDERAKEEKRVTFETLQRDVTYLKSALNLAAEHFKLIPHSPLDGYKLQQRVNDPDPTNTDNPKARFLIRGDEDVRLRKVLEDRDIRLKKERDSANAQRMRSSRLILPDLKQFTHPDHVTPIILLAINTGMDFGDITSLEIKHIDFDSPGFAHGVIRKKRNKISYRGKVTIWDMPLSKEARRILESWITERGMVEGLVFPSPVTGERLTTINSAWETIIASAGIKNFVFKDLRHTFASWHVISGTPLNTVRQLMCHEQISTTQIYAHLSPDHLSDATVKVFD
jgi:integrase